MINQKQRDQRGLLGKAKANASQPSEPPESIHYIAVRLYADLQIINHQLCDVRRTLFAEKGYTPECSLPTEELMPLSSSIANAAGEASAALGQLDSIISRL